MSAVGGERRSLLNNPIFAGILMVIAIVTIVYQWRNITGGVPRVGRRAVTTEMATAEKPTAPTERPVTPQSPPVARTEPTSEMPGAEDTSPSGAPGVLLQELTPPLRDPFAESVIMIEPLMGRAFEEREVLPPPKVTAPSPAPSPTPSQVAVPPARPTLPEWQLVMTIVIGKQVGAVVKSSDQKEILVFPGDTLAGETVGEVSENGVILVGDYGTRAIRLSGFQFTSSRGGTGRQSPGATQSTTPPKSGG